MKKYLVVLTGILLLLSALQIGCSSRNDMKDDLITHLEASRSKKVEQLKNQLDKYTDELRGLEASSADTSSEEEQLAREIEALESRIADVTQQIEQMEKLSSSWLNNSKDWQIKKTQKGVFLISGYGLGWAMGDVSSGKWYYYQMDNNFKPADAPAQKLRNTLGTTGSTTEDSSSSN